MFKRILIDADGCPVVNLAIEAARQFGLRCVIVCDEAHVFERDGAETITVTRGADSVDFCLTNMAGADDLVITQDYGLAAMCLAKKAGVINQDGQEYSENNIDGLLFYRHEAKKARMAGGHLKGKPKRKKEQDEQFYVSLCKMIKTGFKGQSPL